MAAARYQQEVSIISPRLVCDKLFFPLVEYTVCSILFDAEVVTFGAAQPCGIIVAWREENRIKAGVLPISGLIVPESISWDEIIEQVLDQLENFPD